MDGVAAALVGDPGPALTVRVDELIRPGACFYKMTGSGNDFVFFDARAHGAPTVTEPGPIATLCGRGTGVGADGVVFLDAPSEGVVRIAYYNSDGSRADLCGNATLCTSSLAVRLGMVPPAGFRIRTDVGDLAARVAADGPAFDLAPLGGLMGDAPAETEGGERRVGFAVAGVPHLVVRVDDVSTVDVAARGALLRLPAAGRLGGANVNFVSPSAGGWRMRTFERGVEGETLACGTGAVACAAVLRAWDEVDGPVELATASGRALRVSFADEAGRSIPTLSGEGRLVYEGVLRDIA